MLGGSGFVGRALCNRLVSNYKVKVISRNAKKAAAVLPREVEVIEGDVVREPWGALSKYILSRGDNDYSMVNCIGLLHETESRGATFESAHVGLAKRLVDFQPKNLVYISALGIDASAPKSRYAASKKAAEEIYTSKLAGSDSVVNILRPSIIYGASDSFFNRFSAMASYSPFLPLVGGGATKYQPVHVDNVVACIEKCLDLDTSDTYELGGRDVVTFRGLMEMTMRVSGKRRALLNLPYPIAHMQGNLLETIHRMIPSIPPPITRDQVQLLRYDNVVNKDTKAKGFKELGIPVEEIRGCGDADIAYIKK